MPLGDSITYDYRYSDLDTPRPTGVRSGYRGYLYNMLEEAGVNVDFVGSQIAGEDVVPPFDPDNEGHPGWTSYDIAQQTYAYMMQSNPDIVLLHIGTNDSPSTDPDGVRAILDEIDRFECDSGHHIQVLVALIIDRQKPTQRTEQFNVRLLDLLQKRVVAGDDIVIVDMYRGAGLNSGDYVDYTHPNEVGYQKMAQVWFNAIVNNPYDPNKKCHIPLSSYPYMLVPQEFIVGGVRINGNTVNFQTKIPENGIEFK